MEETVKRDCPHRDCVYRGHIAGYETCDYALMERHSRACPISQCDKYKKGKRGRKKNSDLGRVVWGIEEG